MKDYSTSSLTVPSTKHTSTQQELQRIELFKSKETINTQVNYEPLYLESDSSATNSVDMSKKGTTRMPEDNNKNNLTEILKALPSKPEGKNLAPIQRKVFTMDSDSSSDNSLRYLRDKIAQRIEYNLDQRSKTLTDELIRTGESSSTMTVRDVTTRRETVPEMIVNPGSNKSKSTGKPPLNKNWPLALTTFEEQNSNGLPTTVTFHQDTTDRPRFTRRKSTQRNKSLDIDDKPSLLLPEVHAHSTKNHRISDMLSSENMSPDVKKLRNNSNLPNSSKGSTTVSKRSKSKQDNRTESKQDSVNYLTFYTSKEKSVETYTPVTPDRSPGNKSHINESKSAISVSPVDNSAESRNKTRSEFRRRTVFILLYFILNFSIHR